MKNYQKLFTLLTLGALAMSCSSETDENVITEPQSQVTLSASAQSISSASDAKGRTVVNGFATTGFTVGSQNVEMMYAAQADLVAGVNLGNITFKSNVNTKLHASTAESKSLVLVAQGDKKYTLVGEGNTSKGNYSEVNFKLFKNTGTNENDPMFKKSLLLTGEVNGKLTRIWTESEMEIKALTESALGIEVDGNTDLVMMFDMDKLFQGIDFKTAVDADGDGRIEISPNSPDGNAAILSKIESNLKSSVILKKK
ncbi:hypothetical protein P872_05435 [Rhodonellum psychrophilum GCM71 = DSM 17998]|uniref:Lipoprotein n=3 Tax=Rhodonellum TaxID=336827 RepID=U5BQP4_9BACT|nr:MULTISPECIES: hypothetical protein [Rhodonellum]ERM82890.1 hypothetical protein P872_05435 [Rhodonellum psychrophilum GCM71 = DSM 17998]SDY47289.1 hypothetical protein SAMN05444412_101259 [Rhodonellum ikkaensis]